MAREVFQKPLGWLQRFMFNVERGDFPYPQPTIEIGQDWPLNVVKTRVNATSINGSVSSTLYSPGQEKHGLIWTCGVFSNAAVIPAGDTHSLTMTLQDGTSLNLIGYEYSYLAHAMPYVGMRWTPPAASGTIQLAGRDPVYVPAGATVQALHTSTVAGTALTYDTGIIERPKSYPLRLP